MSIVENWQIEQALGDLEGWRQEGAALTKTFEFKDFMGAIGFVNKAAERAEAADHHPDLDIRYNKVTATLSTHSEGGVSEKDLRLAKELESISAAES
jgi:4a-hydroxytetrahydrobiopterin dehydratase